MKINRLKKPNVDNSTKEKYILKINKAQKLTLDFFNNKISDANELGKIIDIYHEAIELIPNKSEPYLALAYISWKLGEYNDSIALLKTVKKVCPLDSKADQMLKAIENEYKKNIKSDQSKEFLENVKKPVKNIRTSSYNTNISKLKRS